MIREEICTYEVCELAKEKGFDVQTFDWYDYTGNYHKGFIPHELHECPRYKEYYAPSQSLLQRWLREEKYLFVNIGMAFNGYYYQVIRTDKFDECIGTQIVEHFNGNKFDTYELALEDALKYTLENLV